ncbi:alpha/beta hydrolase [Anabaena cylindrica FACHB-243]|uniref:Alpha/beta hydrolase fold protein n=1 Tax=Anabaena cylindrica (strain ATCC 27899 / PCC 7122) TaxID=272123 RepID=K9ZB74_ANACC|nr:MULTISPECIES: alpha/beta hydrolase [Anabaena]AFZ56431.1 alpha/beta hydrolase fold protein [Anabaena cylindrica PCC 7122]MBD2418118.1 alpha/beta hydrolase [Anabaena cylindrica FACHB-243]MBY5281964.1 alpha/beta hydrolase [Anabaena sp. CCAP 1446/1C]MBY5311231.1 alpha/beta hydrolase [Anabaena sp. CCAP 1446/1C]MCM2407396.1 alpha/beta hydrolase [Anabaena sp. CCAP 1446/1C]
MDQRLKKLLIGDFTWKRMLKSLILIYVLFAVYVYFRADNMIFLPQPSSYEDTKDIIKLKTREKQQISAVYLPNNQAKYTILYAHGNAEDLGDIKGTLKKLRDLGFNIFAYDYRGYGTSEGTPTENHAYQDIETAYNYLIEDLKIKPEKIIVFGRSVGGGSAVDLAVRKPVAGLILESAFTSAFRFVVPFPVLPFDKFTNLDKIKKVKSPVLVIHGKSDEIIPFTHGEKLFAAVNSPKLYLWVETANHNNVISVAGENYGKSLREFTDLILKN